MRDSPLKKRFMIGAGAVLFVLVLNLFSSQVRGVFQSASSPLQAALWSTGDSISTFLGGGELKNENQQLQEENFSLISQIVELQEIKRENEELRRALDLEIEEEFDLVFGEVIGKNIAEDVMIIKGGTERGIEKGMPVITPGRIVVGRVSDVSAGRTEVQMLFHEKSSFDAQVAEKQITGVVRGGGRQNITLELVPQEEELAEGDLVITSSLGGIFPEGLLVGEVVKVFKSGADPFQKGEIRSFFDLRSSDFVFIIINTNS